VSIPGRQRYVPGRRRRHCVATDDASQTLIGRQLDERLAVSAVDSPFLTITDQLLHACVDFPERQR
jgi:hypothetical protein